MKKLPKIPKDWKEDPFSLTLVQVDWTDATTSDGWWSWENWQDRIPVLVKTTGYMLPPAKNFLRIAPTIGTHGAFADPWMIPKAWVKKVRRLK